MTATALRSGAAPGDRRVLAPGTFWYDTMRRAGQNNFNERDPEALDVEAWIDYWKRLKIDTLLLSGGGIMAFYPTRVPYHHRSRYLGDRDLFGEFAAAAKREGMRVVARMDPNWCYADGAEAHPEWIARTADGRPVHHPEVPELFRTCMFSTFYTEQMPAIYREMNALYDIDGFFTNGWPSTGRRPPWYNAEHQHLAGLPPQEFHRIYENRVLEIWKLWDGIAKERSPENVYVGNLGGGIRAVTDVMEIAKVAGWFNADHQGRSNQTPVWDCAQQGRVAHAVMDGRAATNVTGGYANADPFWRHTSKAPEETTLWMAQSTASGMVPWFHWLGGSPEDNRFRRTGEAFFRWLAEHEQHFRNEAPVTNLAVVFSQRTNAFYQPPGGGDVTDYLQGWYYALLEARIPFEFLHEQNLTPERLRKFSAIVLPNTAMLSDAQARAIEDYVAGGGAVVATFESGCFDEWGRRRDTPALAGLFGVEVVGPPFGAGQGEHKHHRRGHFARIEDDHPILAGFGETTLLPYGEFRLPVVPGGARPLSIVEPYAAFPPEMVYTNTPRTEESALSVRRHGQGRVVWFSGDVDRSFWLSTNGDLGRLMANAVRWAFDGRQPVRVEGQGLIDVFPWETREGYALHILNYTSPNALRGWVRETYPLGPQTVSFEVAPGRTIRAVEALRAGRSIPFTQDGTTVRFTLDGIADYEVAALT
ncbi:beta-galactosidase trimerization domain-containing protein [Inquilinus limosus]|uniref:beta-galactosidase trimerization domain-containing protein n=1 Tax=Inquilinus limosus TaxID=171674 RepID=UPI003F13EF3D